ncbi:unnamed protein product, partial [Prorocentrum cordatum]
TIDLSAMLTSCDLDDSMFSLNMGVDFDNDDGVVTQADIEELERREAAVKNALYDTMKTSFGNLKEKRKKHRDSLAALRERNIQRRKTTPLPGSGGGAQVAAPVAQDPAAPPGRQGGRGAGVSGPKPAWLRGPSPAPESANSEAGGADAVALKMGAIAAKLGGEAEAVRDRARMEAAER